MALLTVEGIYKDGKVELDRASGPCRSKRRVLVTFLPPNGSREKTTMVEGQHRETLRQQALPADEEGNPPGGPPTTPSARTLMIASSDNLKRLGRHKHPSSTRTILDGPVRSTPLLRSRSMRLSNQSRLLCSIECLQ